MKTEDAPEPVREPGITRALYLLALVCAVPLGALLAAAVRWLIR